MKIGAYVQAAYAKPAYAVECYDARAWPGFEMVLDVLRRAGYAVEHCSAATAHEFPVVLVSITAACDWWSFIAERVRWKAGARCVIVGGAGVLNVRPFLDFADVFVFGRAEGLIADVVSAGLNGSRFAHPAVCYSDEFDAGREYRIEQADRPYPHTVTLENGKTWREAAIGCQRKCLFCGYTWHRRHVGLKQSEAGAGGALWPSSAELTAFDLAKMPIEQWPKNLIVGLDGLSFRLRRAVNKAIPDELVASILQRRSGYSRVYNIVGYPTESECDAEEFYSLARRVQLPEQRVVNLHSTRFRAMPATPLAVWEMDHRDFRRWPYEAAYRGPTGIVTYLETPSLKLIDRSGESSPTVLLDAVAHRGTEADAPAVRAVASSRKFWAARSAVREATLRASFDIDRLMGRYSWADLPTRYLLGVGSRVQIERAESIARKRLSA